MKLSFNCGGAEEKPTPGARRDHWALETPQIRPCREAHKNPASPIAGLNIFCTYVSHSNQLAIGHNLTLL